MMQNNHFNYEYEVDLSLEPFSKREAWKWLKDRACNSGGVSISIRSLAYIWKWHRSKVERFVKMLKAQKMIETLIRYGRTLIKLANQRFGAVINYPAAQKPSQESAQKIFDTDKIETVANEAKSRAELWLDYKTHEEDETGAKENELFFEANKKNKEKKQKKQKKLFFKKEKNTPVGSTKKEKVADFEQRLKGLKMEDAQAFAASIGLIESEVSWELEKFQDYWLTTSRKQPRNVLAAFRNWLRRKIEHDKGEKNYEHRSYEQKGNYAKTSKFLCREGFRRVAIRAAARVEKRMLERAEFSAAEQEFIETGTINPKKYIPFPEVAWSD